MTFKLFCKMFIYFFISGIITFISLLDTLNINQLDSIPKIELLKILLKSILPGLISIKAFIDTSMSDEQIKLEIKTPPTN